MQTRRCNEAPWRFTVAVRLFKLTLSLNHNHAVQKSIKQAYMETLVSKGLLPLPPTPLHSRPALAGINLAATLQLASISSPVYCVFSLLRTRSGSLQCPGRVHTCLKANASPTMFSLSIVLCDNSQIDQATEI